MNYTQQELTDLCPKDVAKFIDDEVLPEYADGLNTAENVAGFMIEEAIDRLRILEIDCTTYYHLHAKIALIDPYIALSQNRKILVAYIQTVFDNWSEEIRTSLKKIRNGFYFEGGRQMIPKFRAWVKPDILSNHLNGVIAEALPNFIYGNCLVLREDLEEDKQFEEILDFLDIELMQSTGLKDKNDVEIFEGDIALITHKSTNYADTYWHSYVEVFRAKNGAYRIRGEHIYETELYSNRKKLTVAGNIYNSPELLKRDRFMTTTENPELLGGMNSDE